MIKKSRNQEIKKSNCLGRRPHIFLFFYFFDKRGFTLIEMLIYVSIIIVVGAVISSFLPQLIRSNSYIQTKGEVLNNSRNAMEIMTQEIKRATSIYTPTSVFGSSPGQLSLQTTRNVTTTEDYTFVDFYIDDEKLYVKKEESLPKLLTSKNIKINSLIFTHLYTASNYPAIKISLTASYDSASSEVQQQSQVNLSSTVSLRSY